MLLEVFWWQSSGTRRRRNRHFFNNALSLLKQTFQEWLEDKAPQLGAAVAYYTVFSLAPLILVLLAIVGVIFRHDLAGAWNKITQQMSYFLDQSAVHVVESIAQQGSQPGKGMVATTIGAAGSAYGAASSLITLLLWVYYSSQILLFGAEFTQVYAKRVGREIEPDEYAVRVVTKEVESR
jgi:uncharacterized BrkB/YihY/UPF0761 family membrane protein